MRARVWSETRARLYDDYIQKLMEKAQIKIDDKELAKIDPNQPGALLDEADVPRDPGEAPRAMSPTPDKDLNTPLAPLHPAVPGNPSNPPRH